jgi:putative spermidine/putrescine transport system permease protein
VKGLGAVYCVLVAAFLLAPVMVLVPLSFDPSIVPSLPPRAWSLNQYRAFFANPAWIAALGVSARVGLGAMATALTLGTLAAMALVRGRARALVPAGAVVLAPRFVPVIIIALSLYALFARLHIVGTERGLILAHTIIATPYVVVIMIASLRGFDRSLEHASLSLGASQVRTLAQVTLPLLTAGLVSAALTAFVVSFDETVVAIFISGTRAATLPKKMWDSLLFEMEPTLPAVATLVLLCTGTVFAAIAIARAVLERRTRARSH